MPQRKDAGGRKSQQLPNHPQPKPSLFKVEQRLHIKGRTLRPLTSMQGLNQLEIFPVPTFVGAVPAVISSGSLCCMPRYK